MGKAPKRPASTTKPVDHTSLPSFDEFKDMKIATIDDLASFIDRFGIYRFYIRSPHSRSRVTDSRDAEEGTWEAGIRLNKFAFDWQRSGPCDTLREALSKVLGVAVVGATAAQETVPAPRAAAPDASEELLV